jgi:3'-5' exoribonuclease
MQNSQYKIEHLYQIAKKFDIICYCDPILRSIEFTEWTGSPAPKMHHYGRGGLLQHTFEVVQIARSVAETVPQEVNMQVLITAAMWHDFGKIKDYVLVDKEKDIWKPTEYKFKTYHICESAFEFKSHMILGADISEAFCISESFIDEVVHCILAHHGQLQWKSPVTPHTKEAWILHLADMASARCADVDLNKPWEKEYAN